MWIGITAASSPPASSANAAAGSETISDTDPPESTVAEGSESSVDTAAATTSSEDSSISLSSVAESGDDNAWQVDFAGNIKDVQQKATAFRSAVNAYKPGSDGATVAGAGQTLFLALSDLQLGIIKSDHATKTMASAKLPMIMMPVNNAGTCTFKAEACADLLGQAIKALDTAEAEIGVKL